MLHIGIYLYCTCTISKETHKSCACFHNANTRSDRIFGRVCMLKASKELVCLFAICIFFINIFQYVTQNSTFTRQNTLSFIILVRITMLTLVSGVHVCDKVMYMVSIQQARLAQSVKHQTSNLRIVGSSPTVGNIIFHFVFCRFRRAPDRSTGSMQMKSSMTSIRCI